MLLLFWREEIDQNADRDWPGLALVGGVPSSFSLVSLTGMTATPAFGIRVVTAGGNVGSANGAGVGSPGGAGFVRVADNSGSADPL